MSDLAAGAASVDITPPLHIPYLGYVPRQGRFEEVHDPLFARALVAESGEAAVAIIAADSIGFRDGLLGPARSFVAEVRRRVTSATGIPADHILLAATHAHSTPETTGITELLDAPGAEAWLQQLVDQLAEAAMKAWRGRRPARLRAGTGRVSGLAGYRRILDRAGHFHEQARRPHEAEIADRGVVDEGLPVLLAETLDGEPIAVVMGYACHAVVVQARPRISADLPGAACRRVEQHLGGICLFLQGACGNINPIRGDTGDFGDVEAYGRLLADEALRQVALLRASPPPAPAAVGACRSVVPLPSRALPPREPLLTRLAAAEADVAAAPDETSRWQAQNTARDAREAVRYVEMGDEPVAADLQALRLGDALILACPGELFVEYGLELRRRSPAAMTFVAAYSNGYLGYIARPLDFARGGYEVMERPWCRVGPGGGERIVEELLACAQRVG